MIDDLNRVVRGLVRLLLGLPANSVRPADQVIPAGGQVDQIATVKVLTTSDAGWAAAQIADNHDGTGTEILTGPRRAVVSVQFFRGPTADSAGIAAYSNAAVDQAARLVQRLQLSVARDLMAGAGLGYLGASEVRNLAELTDATWESRAQVDLHFDFMARETALLPTIGSAQLKIAMQASDGEQTRTFEVTT